MNYMLVLVLFHHLVASHTKEKCLSECQAKCGNEECFECEEPFCPSVCPESLCDDEPYGIPWEPPRFPAGTYKFCNFLARAALGPRFDPSAAQPDWLNRQCGDDGSLQCRLTPPERAGNTAADDWTQWNHAEGNSCYQDWDRFECYNKCMGWCEDACTCTWAHDSRQHRCEYRFTHEWTCACANVCTCQHGVPVSNGNCTFHGANICRACHPFFHLDQHANCKANICKCDHGTAVSGAECLIHGVHECVACDKGYHLGELPECIVNVCYCANGSPQSPGECLEHSTTDCSACNESYHPVSGVQGKQRCEANVCQCENGTPHSADACSQHNAAECATCNKGYHTVSDGQGKQRCEANVCLCENGTPHSVGACSKHKASECATCNYGYYPASNSEGKWRCETHVCFCANGTPYSLGECLEHSMTDCSSCNEGNDPLSDVQKKQRCEGSDVSTFAGYVEPEWTPESGYLTWFESPGGIEVSPKNTVYVADKSGVRLIAPNGYVRNFFMNTTGCRDLALDRNGNAYVTDGEKHSVLFVNISTGRVSRVAGNGVPGFRNGNALDAQFNTPAGIAVDIRTGRMYVADTNNHCIRLISGHQVATVAGSCTNSGFRNGPADEARFYYPLGIALCRRGQIYVCDSKNNRIRFVSSRRVGSLDEIRDQGFPNGDMKEATFNHPSGIAVFNNFSKDILCVIDSFGTRLRWVELPNPETAELWLLDSNAPDEEVFTNLGIAALSNDRNRKKVYVADPRNRRILRVELELYHRSFKALYQTKHLDRTLVRLFSPVGIAVKPRDTIYVSDLNAVHLIALNGTVITLIEKRYCAAIVIDMNGNVLCSDAKKNRVDVLNIETGLVSRVAGNGRIGFHNGHALSAEFNFGLGGWFKPLEPPLWIPAGIALDIKTGSIYVADVTNDCIRLIFGDRVNTAAGTCQNPGFRDAAIHEAKFSKPSGIVLGSAGDIYVSDVFNHCVRRIRKSIGLVDTFAGNGTRGFQDGYAKEAMFNFPVGIALDSFGVIYVTDNVGTRVRCVLPTGAVTTLTGTGLPGFLNGKAAHAQFALALGVAVGSNGNVYVADSLNHRIRRIRVTRRDELVKNDTTMPNGL